MINQAEILVLGIVPTLAMVAIFDSYTHVFERLMRVMHVRADCLLLVVLAAVLVLFGGLIFLTDANDVFAIQYSLSAGDQWARISMIRFIVVSEIAAVVISVLIAAVFLVRRKGSWVRVISLAMLGNLGALIWIYRRMPN